MGSEMQHLLEEAVSSGMFLGVSCIAIDSAGNTLYSGAHGRRLFGSDEPMKTSTGGWIASMSKLMTSVATLHAVQDGLVGLDDDVAQILPELEDREVMASYDPTTKLAVFERLKGKITLRLLLSHSAGFAYPIPFSGLEHWAVDNYPTMTKLTGDFKQDWDRPMTYQPGTSWRYGPGLDWAGKVIEKVSGRTLGEYFQKHIWTPLGMTNTTFHPEKRDSFPCLDMGKREDGPGSKLVLGDGCPYPAPAVNEAGGAGVFSCADDYSKLLSALLDDNSPLLKKDMIEELTRPQLSEAGIAALQEERERWVLPEIPQGVTVDHALGGLVTTSDIPNGRPAGAMSWDGMSHPHWILDRVTGVAMVFFTQILPTDPDTKRLWSDMEKALYASLRK